MKKELNYETVSSAWGTIAVIWRLGKNGEGEKIEQIILPGGESDGEDSLVGRYPGIVRRSSPRIGSFCADLGRALEGQAVRFTLDLLVLAACTAFAQRVLTVCFSIPHGAVLSYGELARRAGAPGGARAAGHVMAGNPFPIVVPCHRIIHGDGTLGGYGGGLAMKKALLEKEGRQFIFLSGSRQWKIKGLWGRD